MFGRGRIETKSDAELVLMRQAGLVVARTLHSLRDAAAPGVTTAELNDFAHERIREQGATSNFLGYHGFTGVICTSVNEEIVHGMPGDRVLRGGDLLSIDCGAIVDGWHGDAAITVEIGTVSDTAAELSRVTEQALWAGIAGMSTGERVGDISSAIESSVDAAGDYGITEPFTGHGIGREMHMEPDVPNSGRAGRGPRLATGVTLAIEPMVTLGSAQARILEDGWTAVTPDGSLAAHWEHTVARTETGMWVLTAEDGGAGRLAELGIPFGAL